MEIRDLVKIKNKKTKAVFSLVIPEDDIVIRNCSLIEGKHGQFISGPTHKDKSGKYTQNIYIGNEGKEYILREVLKLL